MTASRRYGLGLLALAYALLVALCLGSLLQEGELSMGRNPLANLLKTAETLPTPAFWMSGWATRRWNTAATTARCCVLKTAKTWSAII